MFLLKMQIPQIILNKMYLGKITENKSKEGLGALEGIQRQPTDFLGPTINALLGFLVGKLFQLPFQVSQVSGFVPHSQEKWYPMTGNERETWIGMP